MEQFEYLLPSAPAGGRENAPAALCGVVSSGNLEVALCGVVSSGNLEVLMQAATGDPACCRVTIQTSARGFGSVWQAVLESFTTRHALGGTQVLIHDMGATPAVVTLRLGQALSQYTGGH